MWINYLITSYRALKRDRFYVIVNFVTMAVAFSLCTIAYLNFQFNNTFNHFFPGSECLYKVNGMRIVGEEGRGVGISGLPLKEASSSIAGVSNSTRFVSDRMLFKLDERMFREKVGYVDPEFYEMFQYPIIEGEISGANRHSAIVLSEKTATRWFGDSQAVGELVTYINEKGEKRSYEVIAVLGEAPINTSFSFDMLLPLDEYIVLHDLNRSDWSVWVDGTFFQLTPGTDPIVVNKALRQYLEVQNEANPQLILSSYELASILTWPGYERELYQSRFRGGMHPASLMGLISSAVCIMLLACFNFVNTVIAISGKRLKEIGVRKIVGGVRRDIMLQLMGENLVQILLALLVSGVITYYLVPYYNALFEFELVQLQFVQIWPMLIFLVLLWIIMGVMAGAYPAFYISKFQSVDIFRQKVKLGGKNYFSKGLLALQFVIVFYNLFALMAYVRNAHYQEALDKGYEVDGTINIPIYEASHFDILMNEVSQHPKVSGVAGAASLVGFGSGDLSFEYDGTNFNTEVIDVGPNYLETLGVRLQQGQFFEEDRSAHRKELVINELLQRQIGKSMLHEAIIIEGERYTVVGVVDNFKNRSIMLGNKMRPAIIRLAPESTFQYLTMRVPQSEMTAVDQEIESSWYQLFPDLLYRGFFQEEVMKQVRHTNNIIIHVNSFVAITSILISILGLYSLVTLTIQRRIKEFGVRKVLGASIGQIFLLINRELFLLIAIAAIVGLPLAGYFTKMVMDIVFVYHIELSFIYYMVPLLAVVFISLVASAFRSLAAARSNPVHQLRME